MAQRLSIIVFLSALSSLGAEALYAEQTPTQTAAVTDERISSLIRDLGDPAYEKRTAATRRLCAIGMRASHLLNAAAGGGDVEVALRARQLLATFDRLWFAGVEVSLAFTRSSVAWDEPVDLRLTLTNRSDYAARIPFQTLAPSSGTAGSDAEQVGTMLDIADFLRVRHENGRAIEPRVDDIAADPAVREAVDERLKARPAGVLEPGQRTTVTARAFNRGWARYALLDQGTYNVALIYEPDWEDEVLAAQHVGRVASTPAMLRVTGAAPAAVSRGGTTASLAVQRDGACLVAQLTNRTDQPMLVNKNFGDGAPFAVGSWVYTLDDSVREISVSQDARLDWTEFDDALLVNVQPGAVIELARTDLNDLLKALTAGGADLAGDRWTIHFSYKSYFDHHWQQRHGSTLAGGDRTPEILRKPASRRILSARHASNRLTVPRPE
ncbi:MAG: hypothetical protein ACYTFA_15340 [Planctomycetota bacterium]|jgi:hypothetical protein